MATLGAMKARIARETTRDDLLDNGAIAEEIASAIAYYQDQRFWFSEKRSEVEFTATAGQTDYTDVDHCDIAHLIRIDYLTLVRSNEITVATYASPRDMEILLGGSPTGSGRPNRFSYYEQTLRLYPRPDASYQVRIAGVLRVRPPVSDTELNNPWMTSAEELIRARAKRNLYLNSMLGTETTQATAMKALEDEALDRLKRETSSRSQVNYIRPTRL